MQPNQQAKPKPRKQLTLPHTGKATRAKRRVGLFVPLYVRIPVELRKAVDKHRGEMDMTQYVYLALTEYVGKVG